jgi:anti-sigma factor RsiW
MNHDLVVRQRMTERYLLNELDPPARDQFEEHLFDCPDCALDVRAGASFVEQSKTILSESTPETTLARIPFLTPQTRGWFAWLRPSFAVPAMALLLLVAGYQNLVTYPRLRRAMHQPQVLPWASVNLGTWGAGGPAITAAPGKGFLVFLRIPPSGVYDHYAADLYNPSGKVEWSLTIPATPGQDQWPVQVPGANRETGTYTVEVHGITATGESKDLGRTSFELQIQK